MPISGGHEDLQPRPGFQGSETTSVEAIVYPQGGDPVVTSPSTIEFGGRFRADRQSAITSLSVGKAIGQAAGTWSITLKPGQDDLEQSIFSRIVDDDWIDLSILRHGRKWHVLRGLVRGVREQTVTGGNGATTTTITLSGMGYGSIWERTAIWFNPYSSENLGGKVSQQVFGAQEGVLGAPDKAVLGYLQGMLRELSARGRSTWVLPLKVPNGGGNAFVSAVDFNTSGFPAEFSAGGANALKGLSANWLMPRGNLWSLAKEWSDPIFNELFTDITSPLQAGPDDELPPQDTEMTLIFREKPFPTLTAGRSSAWFSLPLNIVPVESIHTRDVGKSGDERYNAFFVAPQLAQEALKQNAIDLFAPLWDPTGINAHGFLRFDVGSKYSPESPDLSTLTRAQRERLRDWYAINPYLLSGTIALGTVRPDIHIGTRLRIPGRQSKAGDETYYVEGINHTWEFGRGGRSTFTVTRGWRGDENDYLNTLQAIVDRYEEPSRAQPRTAESEGTT